MARMELAGTVGMKTLNLALQGGGSHGAFTWGVLDALLEDGRVLLEGLSGTSAGALNAATLASGWAVAAREGRDPRAGARAGLARLWEQVMRWDSLGAVQRAWARLLWGGMAPTVAADWLQPLRGLSPYEANPLGLNPLRKLLQEEVDFAAVAHGPLKVFVSATHVGTGRAVVFTGPHLDADAVMASACLPLLFRAVEIDGEAYWDGGYSANPALAPLIRYCSSSDLMLVQINPLRVEQLPRSRAAILERVNELTFNASLLQQMRGIEFINGLIARGLLREGPCKPVRIHRIDGGEAIRAWPSSSRSSTDAAMIRALFQLGREQAAAWLDRHFEALGQHGTVDIRADYLDDTRLPPPPTAPRRPPGRFRPWLAQLLRRRPR